jgi:hypothetical protein
MWRHLGVGLLLSFLGVACIGTSATAHSACELFGGVCVASVNQCGGSLPYACFNGATCCDGELPVADATVPALGDSTTGSHAEAAIVTTADAATGHDSGSQGMDSGQPVTTHDGGGGVPDSTAGDAPMATVDSGVDAGTSHDAGTSSMDGDGHAHADAQAHDTGTDSHIADSGKSEGDAGFLCGEYASPNEPVTSFPIGSIPCVVVCPSGCQANGCYGGYYCHLTTGGCTKPSNVPACDGGT